MKKGTIPLLNIIFHIFPGDACLKKTVNIAIWTLFALLCDNLGGNDGKIIGVKSLYRADSQEDCDAGHINPAPFHEAEIPKPRGVCGQ
jgi:hypothetical protein